MTSPFKTIAKRNQARRNRAVFTAPNGRSTRPSSGDPRIDLARVQYR